MTVMLIGTSDSWSSARPAVITIWSTAFGASTASAACARWGRARVEVVASRARMDFERMFKSFKRSNEGQPEKFGPA